MILMFFVFCFNCQNFILEIDKEFEDYFVFKFSNLINQLISFYGLIFKWFFNCEVDDNVMKGDVCNWVKKVVS